MAGKVGMVVNYWPTAAEAANFNGQGEQMAAIVTSWDEEGNKAGLSVFPPGAHYLVVKAGVSEGTVEGTFQQAMSAAVALKAEAPAAEHVGPAVPRHGK